MFDAQKWCTSSSSTACAIISTLATFYVIECKGWATGLAVGAIHPLHGNSPIGQLLNTIAGCLAAQACIHLSPLARRNSIWLFIMPSSFVFFYYRHSLWSLCAGFAHCNEAVTVLAFLLVLVSTRCAAEVDLPSLQQNYFFSTLGLFISNIGYYSYGAYLYQRLAQRWILQAAAALPALAPYITHGARGSVLAIALLSWILAIPSDHFLETPFAQFVNKRLARKT